MVKAQIGKLKEEYADIVNFRMEGGESYQDHLNEILAEKKVQIKLKQEIAALMNSQQPIDAPQKLPPKKSRLSSSRKRTESPKLKVLKHLKRNSVAAAEVDMQKIMLKDLKKQEFESLRIQKKKQIVQQLDMNRVKMRDREIKAL